jgi:predicted RNA binding protein YcfA (HicA-like mRNA interferase family)
MPSLPRLSGRKVVQVFTRFGWQIARQQGTLRSLIRNADLTVSEFLAALN